MKKIFTLTLLLFLLGCDKDLTNTSTPTMTPCTITNQGIYISSQPSPNGASSKISTFKIDSVILKSNKFTLWFTEDGTNEKLIATLRRYDNSNFTSGKYYFLDATNTTLQPPYTSWSYPAALFEIKSLNSSQNAFYLYDQFEVCVSNENGKFGILIDGMKVADTRTGNSSEFLTFSLEDHQIITK